MVTLVGGLQTLFADNPDVFVAGDLLWYPVEGDNKTGIAPDALVAFGRPQGHRGSYKQWEEAVWHRRSSSRCSRRVITGTPAGLTEAARDRPFRIVAFIHRLRIYPSSIPP
jgi:hypothetical protein